MKYKYHTLLITALVILGTSCSSSQDAADTGGQGTTLLLNIEDGTSYQSVEHFGASDAWSCQFVGKWPDVKKNAIADLLFSTENDAAGKPKGIGLSLWRFNIGAGSAEQGATSGIGDEWRRAESFLKANGTYDWNSQQGQVWFANAAKQRGVQNLLVFPNSPPVSLTKNGKAFTSNAQASNLDSAKFSAYADYLVNVTEGLNNLGLNVNYISPMNEPQWDWADGGQEGTPFFNNEIAQITTLLSQKIEEKGLDAKINIAECAQIDYLYSVGNKQGRSDQVKDFFTQGSANYVGGLPHLDNAISGHSYFTTSPYAAMVSQRQQLASAVSQIQGLRYWMSEYCILGDNAGDIEGNGRDLGISPALYLAKVIHSDLTVANATAWHWWIAISGYNYKDGLVYVDKNNTDGNYYESKMLWAMGNYSRFIRPGYKRVKISSSQGDLQSQSFLYSAYKDPSTAKLVTVVINTAPEDKVFSLQNNGTALTNLKLYITSAQKNLEPATVTDGKVTVPSRSVVTILTE
jgi:O-glycosyl hydrolase